MWFHFFPKERPKKINKSIGIGFESQHKLCFFVFYTKTLLILEKKFDVGPNVFRITRSPIKLIESINGRFESQHELCFLTFFTEEYTKVNIFFSNVKIEELRP